MSDENCGSTDTSTGKPCQRDAGWGTDRDYGYCTTHTDDDDGPPAHRPTKLTRERQESIAQMLEKGHSVKAACRCNGIHHSTFYDWLEKGDEQEEGLFADFSDRVTRARGAGERKLVDELLEMAREQNDTRAILSILKNRYPDSWGDGDIEEQGGTVEVFLTAERD